MAKKKATAATAKKKVKAGEDVRGFFSATATDVIKEVEKASNVVMREIRDSFDFLSTKATDTVRYTAATTKAVRDRVTSKETVEQLQGLLGDIEEAGESLLNVIGNSFDALKSTVISGGDGRKAPTRKKSAAKRSTTRKKTAARRKTTAKKATVRKTTARRKAPAGRKTAVKKTAARKTTTRKKAPARKKVARKASR